MFGITRSINGISLNGQEFLLDDIGDVLKFADLQSAQKFAIKMCGDKNEVVDLDVYGINFVKFNEAGGYVLL